MNTEDFKIWDWQRVFVGEVPPAFLLESVLRVVVLYLLLIISMRLLGKRIASQLTRNELAAMVSLAAAIGVPILAPDRGIVPPFVIALVVVAISRLVALLSAKKAKLEVITQGSIETLVSKSILNIKSMTKSRIPKERVFAQLRTDSLRHLGEVDRLYIEANGSFTLIKAREVKPGLAIIPTNDPEFLGQLKRTEIQVCNFCGKRRHNHNEDKCSNCEHNDWSQAVA